jgi:hypothetical protein
MKACLGSAYNLANRSVISAVFGKAKYRL